MAITIFSSTSPIALGIFVSDTNIEPLNFVLKSFTGFAKGISIRASSISPNNKYYQDAMNWAKQYLGVE